MEKRWRYQQKTPLQKTPLQKTSFFSLRLSLRLQLHHRASQGGLDDARGLLCILVLSPHLLRRKMSHSPWKMCYSPWKMCYSSL